MWNNNEPNSNSPNNQNDGSVNPSAFVNTGMYGSGNNNHTSSAQGYYDPYDQSQYYAPPPSAVQQQASYVPNIHAANQLSYGMVQQAARQSSIDSSNYIGDIQQPNHLYRNTSPTSSHLSGGVMGDYQTEIINQRLQHQHQHHSLQGVTGAGHSSLYDHVNQNSMQNLMHQTVNAPTGHHSNMHNYDQHSHYDHTGQSMRHHYDDLASVGATQTPHSTVYSEYDQTPTADQRYLQQGEAYQQEDQGYHDQQTHNIMDYEEDTTPVSHFVPSGKHLTMSMIENNDESEMMQLEEASTETPVTQKKLAKRKSTPSARKRKSSKISDEPIESTETIISNTYAGILGSTFITEAEYTNAEAMMKQFCLVPLLDEFIKPISVLHPELSAAYLKVIQHPMDIGNVCRAIRERKYVNVNQIRLDVWRVFANCMRFHSHPSTKDFSIPSFISIALHLREHFNALWQEYMLPSDIPSQYLVESGKMFKKAKAVKSLFERRDSDRKDRLMATGSTALSPKCLQKAAKMLLSFIELNGRVDELDSTEYFQADSDISKSFRATYDRLLEKSAQSDIVYTLADLTSELKDSCDLETNEIINRHLQSHLARLVAKIVVPLYETGCRGVGQSSIWGCMAASVWARENKKRPFWPSIVLGILAPEDQREDWHHAITERNENRLPERLRDELNAGKKRAEQALRRGTSEPMSHFLVEFMGTHEFAWVRESDIIDGFDPSEDPNSRQEEENERKKRPSRNSTSQITNPQLFETALDECQWALSEFERQVRDPCGDITEEPMLGIFDRVCETEVEEDYFEHSALNIDGTDDEAEWLFMNEGFLDVSVLGRKKEKQKVQNRKKQKAEEARKKKAQAERSKKAKGGKKKKPHDDHPRERPRHLLTKGEGANASLPITKKERAIAKVKAYLDRIARTEMRSASNIHETGLLAMALAFRAAAGEIWGEDIDETVIPKRPWEVIDSDKPVKSDDRCALLRQQIELLKADIKRVSEVKQRRQEKLDLILQEKNTNNLNCYEEVQDETDIKSNSSACLPSDEVPST